MRTAEIYCRCDLTRINNGRVQTIFPARIYRCWNASGISHKQLIKMFTPKLLNDLFSERKNKFVKS